MESNIFSERSADLHTHSMISDGQLSVGLLLREVYKSNIKYISITDHENINQVKEYHRISKYLPSELVFIPGVEISTKYNDQEIHIVAYFGSDKVKEVEKIVQPLREEKKKRVLKTIELLKEINIEIPTNLVVNGRKTLNRMVIARFIYNTYKFDSIEQVFKKYFEGDPKFKLDNTYPPTDEIVKELSSIGCFVGVAHPDFLKSWSKIKIVEKLIKDGIKGIEVFHPLIGGNLTDSLMKFCQENNIICLGGSDFHGYDTRRKDLGIYNTFTSSAEEVIRFINKS